MTLPVREMRVNGIASVSTEELSGLLGKPGLLLVDVRESAAYNGWRLAGEGRGGHIPGAVNLPLSWVGDLEGSDFRALLESKGVDLNTAIVVYGANRDDSEKMAQTLGETGCREVLVYQNGLAAWAADVARPMARLANYEKLVHPKWVYDLVHGKHPATYPAKAFVVFEVGWQVRKEYSQGHIPGAVYLDTNEIEAEPQWNRVSDEALQALLVANGVTYDTTVVLYGRDMTAAARAASILMYAGVQDVRMLDGGLEAWASAGLELDTETSYPEAVSAFGRTLAAHPEIIIDIEGARAILTDEDAELVSVRSWGEYTGKISGYSYIKPKGHIAGAVWGCPGSAPNRMDYLRNRDNTMRSYYEVAANWRVRGIMPDKRLAFYCGTGWRASEAFFYAHLMGWQRISVYDGGWYEWSADPSNPIELGEPARPE